MNAKRLKKEDKQKGCGGFPKVWTGSGSFTCSKLLCENKRKRDNDFVQEGRGMGCAFAPLTVDVLRDLPILRLSRLTGWVSKHLRTRQPPWDVICAQPRSSRSAKLHDIQLFHFSLELTVLHRKRVDAPPSSPDGKTVGVVMFIFRTTSPRVSAQHRNFVPRTIHRLF